MKRISIQTAWTVRNWIYFLVITVLCIYCLGKWVNANWNHATNTAKMAFWPCDWIPHPLPIPDPDKMGDDA